MNNRLFIMNSRANGKNLLILGFEIREAIKRGIPMCKEAIEFLKENKMSTGITGGYEVADGYMGYVDGHYEKFESEQAYLEFMNEKGDE